MSHVGVWETRMAGGRGLGLGLEEGGSGWGTERHPAELEGCWGSDS